MKDTSQQNKPQTKAILHIINQPPTSSNKLTQCLAWLKQEDAILFIENGVYILGTLDIIPNNIQIYIIKSDLESRGLQDIALTKKTDIINYSDMVHLILKYPLNKSW